MSLRLHNMLPRYPKLCTLSWPRCSTTTAPTSPTHWCLRNGLRIGSRDGPEPSLHQYLWDADHHRVAVPSARALQIILGQDILDIFLLLSVADVICCPDKDSKKHEPRKSYRSALTIPILCHFSSDEGDSLCKSRFSVSTSCSDNMLHRPRLTANMCRGCPGQVCCRSTQHSPLRQSYLCRSTT